MLKYIIRREKSRRSIMSRTEQARPSRAHRIIHPSLRSGSNVVGTNSSLGAEILRCAQDDMLAHFRITYRTWLVKFMIGLGRPLTLL